MVTSNSIQPIAESTARQNLSVEAWAEAALDVLASGGLDSVAVEPLARRLGVTKGSFYWHFANREALLRAALALWERRETDETIAGVAELVDPYERIVRLFKQANSSHRAGRLYLALAAASDDPAVGEVVQRVSARRLAYLHDCYRALGLDDHDAHLWSTFAYATFIGNQQVHRDTPDQFPSGPDFREYFKLMLKTLIPRVTAASSNAAPAPAGLAEAAHPTLVPLRKPAHST
jgi:AcrR family transcriptional regulator